MWICRLTLAQISSEISAKLLGMPTHLDRSSLTATGLSLSCRLVTSAVASAFANCLLWVPLSNSLTRVPLPTSGHVENRGLRPLFGFAPKQTKGSSAWRTTYIVLHKALNPRDDINRLYVSRKEGRRGPLALKVAWMNQYNDTNKDRTITVASNRTDKIRTSRTRKPRKQKWGKNNCKDISCNKQTRSHTIRPGDDYEKETLRKKLNFF